MTKVLTVLILFLLQANAALADVKSVEIDPSVANPQAVRKTGNHVAFWDESVASQNLLLISFGGTNSRPTDFANFDNLAAEKGFQVLAIDYDNHVISTTCATSTDPLCFDKFREENMRGVDVYSHPEKNKDLQVSPADAIETRINDTLKILVSQDPQRWGPFLTAGKVQWNKIVAIGHSQGSGHAAYLGHLHSLHGVLMFAGPQDRFTDSGGCTSEVGRLANWILQEHQTTADRYYSFSHVRDCFSSAAQVNAAKAFTKGQSLENHLILSDTEGVDGHMAVINPMYSEIWERLLDIQLQKQ